MREERRKPVWQHQLCRVQIECVTVRQDLHVFLVALMLGGEGNTKTRNTRHEGRPLKKKIIEKVGAKMFWYMMDWQDLARKNQTVCSKTLQKTSASFCCNTYSPSTFPTIEVNLSISLCFSATLQFSYLQCFKMYWRLGSSGRVFFGCNKANNLLSKHNLVPVLRLIETTGLRWR